MTYHDGRTGSQPDASGATGRLLLAALAIGLAAVTGCVESHEELPVVGFEAESAGVKMLRPNATARACATRILGMTSGNATPPLERALRDLRALDAEADLLARVRVDTSTIALGIFDRTCISVHADVVRQTSVVRLPAPPGHEGHH